MRPKNFTSFRPFGIQGEFPEQGRGGSVKRSSASNSAVRTADSENV
ncbi:hypothetical protein [Chryseobacterium sp. BGARF1]|nr:hypothetical protein [Chryseobacterium sp. BGARF1]